MGSSRSYTMESRPMVVLLWILLGVWLIYTAAQSSGAPLWSMSTVFTCVVLMIIKGNTSASVIIPAPRLQEVSTFDWMTTSCTFNNFCIPFYVFDIQIKISMLIASAV